MGYLLMLVATVWRFAHLLLCLSIHNKVVLGPGYEDGARYNLHKKNVQYVRFIEKTKDVVATSRLALHWKWGFRMPNTWKRPEMNVY